MCTYRYFAYEIMSQEMRLYLPKLNKTMSYTGIYVNCLYACYEDRNFHSFRWSRNWAASVKNSFEGYVKRKSQ